MVFVCLYVPDEACEYCPDRALSAALHDWMEELNQPLQAGETSCKVAPQHVCACHVMDLKQCQAA